MIVRDATPTAPGSLNQFLVHARFFLSELNSTPPNDVESENFELLDHARLIVPNTGLNTCQRAPIRADQKIKLMYEPKRGSARYRGLQNCRSIGCPVCGPKRTQKVSSELEPLIAAHKKSGREILFVSFTIPHFAGESLAIARETHSRAMRYFRSGRAWSEFKKTWKLLDMITIPDVTFGNNGWHFHSHALIFLDMKHISNTQAGAINAAIKAAWIRITQKMGRSTSKGSGVNLRRGAVDVRYMLKSIGMIESDRQRNQPSNISGLSPRDLLRISTYAEDSAPALASMAGALYREYTHALKGIHRVSSLKNLQRIYESHNRGTCVESEVASFDKLQWKFIIKNKLRSWIFLTAKTAKGDRDVFRLHLLRHDIARHLTDPLDTPLVVLRPGHVCQPGDYIPHHQHNGACHDIQSEKILDSGRPGA